MRVAVYAIAKNEEQFVERWAKSAEGADYLLIADTGSTDNTVAKAKELGINVYTVSIDPWRFDDARNAALALIPADIDYCIALDMDEVLEPGWKWQLKKAFDKGITRPSYKFISSLDSNGNPINVFDGFRIHARKNVRWKYPIHEVPEAYGRKETRGKCDLVIKHLPDNTKSRGQYLPMLEMALEEDPSNQRHMYYLGREYFYHKRYEEAADMLLLYIDKSQFPAEKSMAYRMLAVCEPEEAEHYFLLSIEAFPGRESYLALANHYLKIKEWKKCIVAANAGMEYTERDVSFLSDENYWGHMGYDLIAVAAWQINEFDLAYKNGKKAVEITPNDERLQNNLKFYQEKINGDTK